MNRQRGVTFVGMVFIAGLIVFAAIIGLKLVPAYIEYATVVNNIRDVAREVKTGSAAEVQASFRKHAQIDGITSVKPEDVEVEKDGDKTVIRATWSTKIKLFGNLNACIDFVAASDT